MDVYEIFQDWLASIGIIRNYSSNLRSLNKHFLKEVSGTSDLPQVLFDNVRVNLNFCLDEVYNLVQNLINNEILFNSEKLERSEGYLNDWKSAFKKFYWFLKTYTISSQNVAPSSVTIPTNIIWLPDVRKQMNIDQRITSQDRLNKNKNTNFPIRLILLLANNVAVWAKQLNLPEAHPAYKLKEEMDKWLDEVANNIVFLIEGNKSVKLADVKEIGLSKNEDNTQTVYIKLKDTEAVHHVMTRKPSGEITPMILDADDGLSALVLDHVYRMEDILTDFGDAFPFLQELTKLFRDLNQVDIRSAETRQKVLDHIHENFKEIYASKIGDLISELRKLQRLCAIEVIYKKDNLGKH